MKARWVFLAVVVVLGSGLYLLAGNAQSADPNQGTNPAVASSGATATPSESSIGEQAALMVNDLSQKASVVYRQAGDQAEKTTGELQRNADQFMTGISAQAEEFNRQLRIAYQDLLAKYQAELKKFQETLKKSQSLDQKK